MSYQYTIEVFCDDCGRSTTAWRGGFSSKAAARANVKRAGWEYDQKAGHHTCPDCIRRTRFSFGEILA